MAERLTDRGIAALKPSGKSGSDWYFNSEVSGLALRVYPTGRKVFAFDWRERHGKQRRVTIGAPPAWTIGKARTHASRLRLKADTGETVAPQRGALIKDLARLWLESVRLTRRPNSVKSYTRLIQAHIVPAFGRLEPRALTRNRIEAWHGEIAQRAAVTANRCLAVLSSFLNWCQHDRRIEHNPAKGIKRKPENQRHVFLDANEIIAAHAALGADPDRPAALALRLALLTGCRIGEVLSLAPEQIDGSRKIWIKPASTTKQKRLHIVPLQAEALTVAQALLQFGRPRYLDCWRVWERTRAIINRREVHIHDLRHSRASALARGGASLLQIGKVLGHSSHATTARYAHLVDSDLVDLIERS